jgi:hypothetical protein
MLGNIFDSEHFAQFVNVPCQSVCHMLASIGKARQFNTYSATGIAPYFSVIDLQKNLGVCHIQVTNEPDMVFGMNRSSFAAALMAKRLISHIRFDINKRRRGVLMMNVLFDNLHSCKREIPCYTNSGHCATPFFTQVLFDRKLTYRKAA